MRTVFVNPSRRRRRRNTSESYENPKRRRGKKRRPRYVRVRALYRRRNPDLGVMLKDTTLIAAGAAGGALLNRLGISHITNFYARNAARVGAAALITQIAQQNPVVAIAAAGAVLAPMAPEIEMQMASTTKANPAELAAELAELLEADLSDDVDAVGDDEMSDELEDELDI